MSRALLLLLASALLGAQEISVDLSGPWKIHPGDDPAWASPDFDDRAWSGFALPTSDPLAARGTWLRRWFHLPPAAATQPLVITIGGFAPEYEIFLNGFRLATVNDSTTYVRVRLFDVSPGFAQAGAGNVVALRVKRSVRMPIPRNSLRNSGPFLVTGRANAPVLAPALEFERRLRRLSPEWGWMLAFAVLALLLFVLWLGQATHWELLALALFLALEALESYVRYFGLMDDQTRSGAASQTVWWLFFTLAFTYATCVLRFRPRPIWWTGAIPAVLVGQWLMLEGDTRALLAWLGIAAIGVVLVRRWKTLHGGRALALTALVLPAIIILRGGNSFRPVFLFWEIRGFLIRGTDIAEVLLAVAMIIVLVRRLIDDRREKDRLGAELEAARTVQQLLISNTAAAGVDAVYLPANEVGGDFYWSRTDPGGALVVVAGDVSGKGLKAAMLVSVAIGILRNEKSPSPALILAALNEGLVGHTGGGFVTCCCARFDPAGRVTIANAGHPAPYREGAEVPLEAGLPLGVVPGVVYAESEVSDGRFTFVSDGVIEAANAAGELFGFERTRAISTQSAQAIADAAKQWGQNDDITVVTVRRTP